MHTATTTSDAVAAFSDDDLSPDRLFAELTDRRVDEAIARRLVRNQPLSLIVAALALFDAKYAQKNLENPGGQIHQIIKTPTDYGLELNGAGDWVAPAVRQGKPADDKAAAIATQNALQIAIEAERARSLKDPPRRLADLVESEVAEAHA